ncbi:EpsI family protein [Duganella sp. FT135W]|uniref:EpsI family protein n=1 Tax=Duganella flavida TaxID=2692175 RepID=A0A6L8KJB9_9BURK|nr:exosortase-associated protein EpsI, B-type [Duganella flavida]MYM26308.1 EpsI family protein [Duganella flavida]
MNLPLLRSAVLGLAMLAAAAATVAITPTVKIADHQEKVDLQAIVPSQFGDWRVDPNAGAAVAPSADVQANLDKTYDQILSRTYVNSAGDAIMLTVSYGSQQTQELRAHRQEVCYAAQGFDINNLSHDTLSIGGHAIPVTRMLAINGPRSEPVTYWFTMGDQVVLSRTERFLVQLKYSFSGIIPDGMLVRVSNLTRDEQGGYRAHEAFLAALMKAVDRKSADKLMGAPTGHAS